MNNIRVYNTDFFFNFILSKIDVSEFSFKTNTEIENEYYDKFTIKKNDGSDRVIYGIKSKTILWNLQTAIKNNLLSRCTLPSCAIGFVKGKSYKNFLVEHTNKKYYLSIDIKDFFGSIKEVHVRKALKDIITITNQKHNHEIVDLIIKICLLNGFAPQGAITSPDLANLVFRYLDRRIEKYCNLLDITYTRYADDLLFSSNSINFGEYKKFINKINFILKSEGFDINYKKVKVSYNNHILNGIIVGKNISFSKTKV